MLLGCHVRSDVARVVYQLNFTECFMCICYKTILLTMINFYGPCKMIMFSVQFMAEFSRMTFCPVNQSKTHLVP